jgi:hypothetical protein
MLSHGSILFDGSTEGDECYDIELTSPEQKGGITRYSVRCAAMSHNLETRKATQGRHSPARNLDANQTRLNGTISCFEGQQTRRQRPIHLGPAMSIPRIVSNPSTQEEERSPERLLAQGPPLLHDRGDIPYISTESPSINSAVSCRTWKMSTSVAVPHSQPSMLGSAFGCIANYTVKRSVFILSISWIMMDISLAQQRRVGRDASYCS